jgi:hypothetical protein
MQIQRKEAKKIIILFSIKNADKYLPASKENSMY